MKLKTLFYSNKIVEGLKPLLYSLSKYKYDYSFIGQGEKFNGFGTKLNSITTYIRNYLDDSYTHVMVLDAYDLIVIRGQHELEDKYKSYFKRTDIIFSAETNCYPNNELKDCYPEINNIFKYLNAGSWIMPIDKLKYLFINRLPEKTHDQEYFTRLFLNTDKIKLDYECRLFQTLYGLDNNIIKIKDNTIYNELTDSYPCIIHDNGKQGQSELFQQILKVI